MDGIALVLGVDCWQTGVDCWAPNMAHPIPCLIQAPYWSQLTMTVSQFMPPTDHVKQSFIDETNWVPELGN